MMHSPASHAHPHSCDACTLSRSFCPSGSVRGMIDRVKASSLYESGATAFHEAEPCHSVFLVCRGRVKLLTASRTGRTLLLRLAGEGELLAAADAVAGAPYSYSAVAAEPAVLSAIPRDTFLRLITSYPTIARRLTDALCEQYQFAREETRFLGFGETSSARLARLLMTWGSDDGTEDPSRPGHIPPYVTHTDLAQAIGATRETVTRILSDFKHRGFIVRDDEAIVIRNARELSNVADGRSARASDEDAKPTG
jgi:CRP/FNR family transcriptional regulator, cyclic AMP receptor protein